MGKITVTIDDDLEMKVRVKIAKAGGKKGDLKKSIESALKLWVNSKSTEQQQHKAGEVD